MPSAMSHPMTNMFGPHSDHTSQRYRLQTFKRNNVEEALPAISLSNAGFVQSSVEEELDVIECPFCELKLRNIDLSHNPLVWHRVYSRSCPFMKFNKHVNVRDLGISFPENSALTVDLGPVVLRSGPLDGGSMEDDDDEEMPSNGSQAEPHITISHDVPDRGNDGNSTTSTSAEELNKLYRSLDQLQQVLPKSHIDVIRQPLAQIESLLFPFAYERHRRLTFNNWPKKDAVSPRALAASGFVYLHETEDTVGCVFCKVHVANWTADMVPDVVHMKKSKHCQFMKGARTVRNIPDILADIFEDDPTGLPSNDSELGIITESARHPDFAVESRRKATFLTWPSSNHKLASEMIEHALFYTGHGDVVCCFSCGIEMSGWTSTDNIWRRHARQAPHCQLVIQEKSSDWVAATIEEHGRYHAEEREPAIITVTTRMLRPKMDNPATQQVLKLQNPSYPRDEVRSCLIQNIKYGHPDYMNRKDIVTAILERRDDKRQSEAELRALDTEPAPPYVVCPPRRPGVGEDEEALLPSTIQPSVVNREEPSTSAALGAAVTGLGYMEAEPTPSTSQAQSPAVAMDLDSIRPAQLVCKICMSAPVGVVFLPCGHMVCCPSCAHAMVQCPACRQDVQETVQAHLDKRHTPWMPAVDRQQGLSAVQPPTAEEDAGGSWWVPEGDPMEFAREMKDRMTCKICFAEPKELIYVPCGHMVCSTCDRKLTEFNTCPRRLCPTCKAEINATVKTNLWAP